MKYPLEVFKNIGFTCLLLIITHQALGQTDKPCLSVSEFIDEFRAKVTPETSIILNWYRDCYVHETQNISTNSKFIIFEIISDALIKNGEYKEALDLVHLILFEGKKLTSDQSAQVYSVQCRVFSLIDSWEFAEESYQKSFQLIPEIKSKQIKVEVLITLAEMKRRSSKGAWRAYELLYLARGIVVKEKLGDELLAKIHGRLAAVFEYPKVFERLKIFDIDSIYKHALLSKSYALNSKSLDPLASAYNHIGAIKRTQNKHDSALYYFDQASRIWSELGNPRSHALGLLNQCTIYHETKQYSVERKLLDSILFISTGKTWSYERKQTFSQLSENAEAMGYMDSALLWYRKMNFIDDSIANNFLLQRDEIVRSTFEVNEMKSKILKQKEEIKIKTEDKRSLVVYIFLLILLASGITLVLIRFRYFNRIAKKHTLEVSAINEDLKVALAEKELLFQELNHRVKNNLAMLSGLLEIQRSKTSHEHTRKVLNQTIGRISTISEIHKNVYQNEVVGSISVIPLMNEMIEHQRSMLLSDENHELTCNLNELQMDASQVVPFYLIFNEILTNAVKYGVPIKGSKIHIDLLVSDKTCELIISDSGPGIPDSINSNETMGLYLVQLLCSSLDGTLSWNQENMFKVKLKFPLKDET